MIEEIVVPKRAVVHEHIGTKAKYTSFPFIFGDGTPGTLTVIKGVKGLWKPSKDIKKITIEFND